MIEITVSGVPEIQAFMKALGTRGIQVVTDELHKVAIDVRNDMLKSMRNTNKGGKTYKTKGIFHTASSPGFPPAIRSGNLANRIFIEKGFNYSKVFTDNVKYANYLEKGTSKMQARPFFEPAINRSAYQKKIMNRIIAERFAGRGL